MWPERIFLPGKIVVKDILKKLKLNEDTISSVLGVLAVVLVVYLVWGYFKNVNREKTTSTNTEATSSAQMTDLTKISQDSLPVDYVVQSGDSLWKIAQTVYGSGYEWTKIYSANKGKVANPSVLWVGTTITLPKLESATAATTEYTVVAGDNLWNIGVRLCNSGFVWSQIAADNNLANPGTIHRGNVLKVRCGK